jgi:hypothetical protein
MIDQNTFLKINLMILLSILVRLLEGAVPEMKMLKFEELSAVF